MRPPSVVLTDQQVREFSQNGYLALSAITTSEEVARLHVLFERLFRERVGFSEGLQHDLLGHDDEGKPPLLPQIFDPWNFAPELRNTHFRSNALAIAKQLLGDETMPHFEHAILKPAHYGVPTPWHQDEAHGSDTGLEQVSFWMPLQEASLENGCMHYIPGSHRAGILEHSSPGNDSTIPALECRGDFNPADAVACPLPAGGCAIHHGRVLHYAGPNRSAIQRCAYILVFRRLTGRPNAEYPWNAGKRIARQMRRSAWWRRGGILIEIRRKGLLNVLQRAGLKVQSEIRRRIDK
jgi:ectoine hydroxylase-related dioxygenase (phytanoyl-CoA dioxygenase family)